MAKRKMKVYQYTAVFEPDKKAGGFTVTIPSLPGCISEGDTFEKALKNIEEAAGLYLETMKKDEDIVTKGVLKPSQKNAQVARPKTKTSYKGLGKGGFCFGEI